jgi:hypothetical protein
LPFSTKITLFSMTPFATMYTRSPRTIRVLARSDDERAQH